MSILEEFPCLSSLAACFLLATLYVASLYVWRAPLNRDHPSVIKRRTVSVLVVSLISPFIIQLFITDEKFVELTMWELHGFRTKGLFFATVLPLILTMTLFLGPLCMQGFSGFWKIFVEPMFWVNYCDAVWLRNYIIAPFSEEFTFRACMLPVLLQAFKPVTAIFISPLFFGMAHVHHVYEKLKSGMPLAHVICMSLFQFFYTTVFGAYSALLFVKTGHFVAPFLAHSFCNMMGFPDFIEVLSYRNPRKTILIFLFVFGVILWYFLITPLTSHKLYDNNVFWRGN